MTNFIDFKLAVQKQFDKMFLCELVTCLVDHLRGAGLAP